MAAGLVFIALHGGRKPICVTSCNHVLLPNLDDTATAEAVLPAPLLMPKQLLAVLGKKKAF